MERQTGQSFPQEIWWLVSQEFANRRDFGGLFLCARLGKGIARLALPELYAIHDQSPAINAHILDIETSICLWRSIIASSLGRTLFPYCCWIKALKLGNLHSQLEDLARDNPGLKASFFSPPLEKLQIRRGRGRALDLEAIIIEVANLVTECIRTSAAQESKRVALTALEGNYLPTANLPKWVSSLSSLTSLSVRDGSVLNSDVARAIRANCPAFRDLECFFCSGTDLDEDLAGFFRNLEPNTLVSFTILSMNEIGRQTFKALGEHSSSLKSLSLFSLERAAFQALNELQHCLSLESLRLEGAPSARRYLWEIECKPAFQEVVQWLQQCTALRELEFTVVPTSTTILAEVLKSPVIRLTSLSLLTFDLDKEFCLSLLKQQDLRHLAVKIRDEDLLESDDERHTMLANAVACCHELRELDTNELFSLEEIEHICESLPQLEEIVLNGDLIDNEFLTPLSRLSKLKSLNIFGPSFTDEEEAKVTTALWDLFRGRFDINYRLDPDELHESDFSD
ncbi:hypothetical protein CHGG_03053 [Chaetomium globosum CBS 148.51]|uniref:F-box domain-containing protein n=1 Tax=Chaetomium globosum (strain ATCC 6205 / CBS 148.51 / DSM 1962 / NBRC 6347 / NRRL 1970) TaxID=306901 RepID=Q2H9Q1_CHAGB|nr:uncharacterized protein CHGG_03053 [Chaetomium globosum CBS 148.51]EAQ91118.1 hypothetical protein CHGG_03053 [Chaetomium globosum CBS 148.51]